MPKLSDVIAIALMPALWALMAFAAAYEWLREKEEAK